MNFILDTSAFSAAQRDDKKVVELLNRATQIYLPLIVEGEIRAGYEFGSRKNENNQLLDRFMTQSSVVMINLSDKTPVLFAEIYSELRKTGQPIGQNDLWIAALTREYGLPILTRDNDFKRVSGLELVG